MTTRARTGHKKVECLVANGSSRLAGGRRRHGGEAIYFSAVVTSILSMIAAPLHFSDAATDD